MFTKIKHFVPLAYEDCFKKLKDMQADIYLGFPIGSIHPAVSFTFTLDACNTGKVFICLVSVWEIYGSGTVSTSSCMFRIETNGETDLFQHNLFVGISYKFTLA